MKHPGYPFIAGARPACAQYCLPLAYNLGLHEKITECRMNGICNSRGKDHLSITCDVNGFSQPGSVCNAGPSEFDIILGRYHDFCMGIKVIVATTEFSASF
jgi:hypothetical protein